jgi:hypothetical protein
MLCLKNREDRDFLISILILILILIYIFREPDKKKIKIKIKIKIKKDLKLTELGEQIHERVGVVKE